MTATEANIRRGTAGVSRAALTFSAASMSPLLFLIPAALFGGIWAWAALIYITLVVFLLDELITFASQDAPDEQEFPASERLSIAIGVSQLCMMGLTLYAFTTDIGLGVKIALFLASGLYLGQIGNSNAHELIHRPGRWLRRLGKLCYIAVLYGHHSSAHPLVHHVHVATDRDPNSARQGEGFYRFATRAWVSSFKAGLEAETARHASKPFWRRPFAAYVGGALLFVVGVGAGLGPGIALAYVALSIFVQSQLLVSDYVQHYGLRRDCDDNGKPEPVGAEHSWNAPQVMSAHMMLNAPRHSHHHTNPGIAFPGLELPSANRAPMLPMSLPVMSLIALLPPVWRRMMTPRLLVWQAARFRPSKAD